MACETDEAVSAPRRILIIKPSSLGDVVHTLPVLAALRSAYPHAHIAWLVGAGLVSLLQNHPLLDEVIPFDRQRYGRILRNPWVLADFLRFVGQLRRRSFDLVVDLQGLFRSGFLAWASGAPRRVGFAHARELAPLFYTRRIRCARSLRHAVEKNLFLAAALGLHPPARHGESEPPTTASGLFPLGLRSAEKRAAQNLLATAAGRPLDRFTAVLPGARWPSKLWLPERLAELIDRIHQDAAAAGHAHAVVLLGAAADREFTNLVIAACHRRPVDLVGRTTVRELVAMLALAERVVCHDSGPMHIAAALDKPLVAIFGPTDPARTGPYSSAARVVGLPLECAPCLRRVCPLGHHRCMTELPTDAVLAKVRELPANANGTSVAAR